MEEAEIPNCTVFVGYGHLHHSRAAWKDDHASRYNMVVRLNVANMKEEVAFAMLPRFDRRLVCMERMGTGESKWRIRTERE